MSNKFLTFLILATSFHLFKADKIQQIVADRFNTSLKVVTTQTNGVYYFYLQSNNSVAGEIKVQENLFNPNILAEAYYYDSFNKTGWDIQKIRASPIYDDAFKAYWTGYLDIKISKPRAKAHFHNIIGLNFCRNPDSIQKRKKCTLLSNYIKNNIEWMKSQSLKLSDKDPFWNQIRLQLWQMKGHQDAWMDKRVQSSKELTKEKFKEIQIDPFGIYLLQLADELDDIKMALYGSKKRLGRSHCSAIVKLVNRELFTSHVTWDSYSAMLRVVKHYDLPFLQLAHGNKLVPGRSMSFSGYPGRSNSGDDFYIMNTKIVTIETTNDIINASLYRDINRTLSIRVPEFMRSIAANRLAVSGSQWAQIFAKFNSGTYSNQWMIVDYKRFNPKSSNQSGLLTVAEQMPDLVVYADLSQHLYKYSYWGSYNIPYFKEVFNKTGYPALVKKFGDVYTHDRCPRARIFRRDHSKVKNVPTLFKLMRYNNFKHDPISRCNCTPPYSAARAISSRMDLEDPRGKYPYDFYGFDCFGATDAKIAVLRAPYDKILFYAQSGPTFDQVPPFKWSTSKLRGCSHILQPDLQKFNPYQFNF